VLKAILRAIDRLELSKDEVTMISGIGCSGRVPGYVDFNTLHTTHGRALAFATGIKLGCPEMTVIVASGDGDATAIGGNHFIHAARRNIDMTAVIFNNHIYGMTGGQASPTTPMKAQASTTPYGNIEPPFDISGLAIAAGAAFVARGTNYHATQLDKLIEAAIRKRGFSVVEVITSCPTAFGRRNRMGSAVDILQWQREHAIRIERASLMTEEELEGKIVTGILANVERPEYSSEYAKISARAQAER
jgi:2-oxoglutarate ferredoxin oxidoreductase subunit beta